jgi:hypothetical protein
VNGANWSVELQLQKVGQWGPLVWKWHFIGQRENWWTEGNSTEQDSDNDTSTLDIAFILRKTRSGKVVRCRSEEQ